MPDGVTLRGTYLVPRPTQLFIALCIMPGYDTRHMYAYFSSTYLKLCTTCTCIICPCIAWLLATAAGVHERGQEAAGEGSSGVVSEHQGANATGGGCAWRPQ